MALQTLESARRVRADLEAAIADATSAEDLALVIRLRWNLKEWDRMIAGFEKVSSGN